MGGPTSRWVRRVVKAIGLAFLVAAALGFTVIGVNSRNLHTMQVEPQTWIELAQWLPHAAVHVAESGIQSGADIAQMRSFGYHAFLVGESLMRQPDPAAALAALLNPRDSPER